MLILSTTKLTENSRKKKMKTINMKFELKTQNLKKFSSKISPKSYHYQQHDLHAHCCHQHHIHRPALITLFLDLNQIKETKTKERCRTLIIIDKN